MLFSKAADYLTEHIGLPTAVDGPPARVWRWMLSHRQGPQEFFEVKLRDGPTKGEVSVEILDPLAGFLGSEEELTLHQEGDFQNALERVQAHLNH